MGQLQLNHTSVTPNSKDAVTIHDDKISIRLPWSLINFVAPNELKVMHGNKAAGISEDTLTDGISFAIKYKDRLYSTSSRYIWETWNKIDVVRDTTIKEVYKTSYWVMKDRLTEFNNKAIAVHDSIYLEGPDFPMEVSVEDGVLMNDFDLDGDILMALLLIPPQNGNVSLNNDGSFSYMPNTGFNGYDSFEYTVFDGYSLSVRSTVVLNVHGNASAIDDLVNEEKVLNIFPNPSTGHINIASPYIISEMLLFDITGQKLATYQVNSFNTQIDLSSYPMGDYILLSKVKDKYITQKIVLTK